jgi:hypothetical protein
MRGTVLSFTIGFVLGLRQKTRAILQYLRYEAESLASTALGRSKKTSKKKDEKEGFGGLG